MPKEVVLNSKVLNSKVLNALIYERLDVKFTPPEKEGEPFVARLYYKDGTPLTPDETREILAVMFLDEEDID